LEAGRTAKMSASRMAAADAARKQHGDALAKPMFPVPEQPKSLDERKFEQSVKVAEDVSKRGWATINNTENHRTQQRQDKIDAGEVDATTAANDRKKDTIANTAALDAGLVDELVDPRAEGMLRAMVGEVSPTTFLAALNQYKADVEAGIDPYKGLYSMSKALFESQLKTAGIAIRDLDAKIAGTPQDGKHQAELDDLNGKRVMQASREAEINELVALMLHPDMPIRSLTDFDAKYYPQGGGYAERYMNIAERRVRAWIDENDPAFGPAVAAETKKLLGQGGWVE
jgi:hypothetical protein